MAEQQPIDNSNSNIETTANKIMAGPEKLESEVNSVDDLLSQIPLFMTEMPTEDNAALAAIQSLLYDGTPEEVAQNFREQGNDCFLGGKYSDAAAYYTKAIDTDCEDKSIMEACLANRAACNLELKNYGRVLSDCSRCLKINPKNIKAWYRSAKALLTLDKLVEAIDICDHALLVDAENKPIQEIRQQAAERKAFVDEKIRLKEEREQRERNKKQMLNNALKERNIEIQVDDKQVREQANVEYDQETQTINWPVIFLYPEHKENDYIQAFNETSTFLDQLQVMFEQPAPWDVNNTYTIDNMELYFEDRAGKLIKIGKKLPLGKILALKNYVVKNGVPSFIILPKNSTFKQIFIENHKKKQ